MNANQMEVTKEEDEAMDALCRLGAGVPLTIVSSAEVLHNQSQLDPQKIIDEMMAQFSISLKLLLTVINQTKAQPTQGNSHGEKSLQECVSLTLQQAEWFKEMVEKRVDDLVDDMDHTYGIESAVDSFFTNEFSLDDHVDITAEVENRIEEIVEEQLADVVSEKLSNLRITFD